MVCRWLCRLHLQPVRLIETSVTIHTVNISEDFYLHPTTSRKIFCFIKMFHENILTSCWASVSFCRLLKLKEKSNVLVACYDILLKNQLKLLKNKWSVNATIWIVLNDHSFFSYFWDTLKYSGVCYNERCYKERMLQRTIFINRIRMLQRTRRNTIGRRSTRVRMSCRSFPLWLERQSSYLLSFVRIGFQFSSFICLFYNV
jgi:hypothetical protein